MRWKIVVMVVGWGDWWRLWWRWKTGKMRIGGFWIPGCQGQ